MSTYLFEEEPVTCVSLEVELGLNRGDISQLTIYPSGAVGVETASPLDPAKEGQLRAILVARGLGKGQKPNR